MRFRFLSIVLLCVAMAAGAAPAKTRGAAFDHRGRWITDARGRVVMLHGVNVIEKVPPYLASDLGFDDDDAAFLAREGFNTVRLGIILKGLEPKPGRFDDVYLGRILATATTLGSHGIRVLLDFHQDLFNERFQGEGLPDWMVQDDGLPAIPPAGFPGNYFAMPALWRAYDHLWANDPGPNGIGLQDWYGAAWAHVAARVKGQPWLLGYDLFNEPWPGTQYPTCLNTIGCPLFDAMVTEFYKRVIAHVRPVDPATMVFYGPNPTTSGGPGMNLQDTGDPHAALSFHMYCLGAPIGLPSDVLGPLSCPLGEDRTFDVAEAQAKQNGDAILMSEFGATDDLTTVARDLEAADRHMDPWQYWAYSGGDPCCPRPAEGVILDPKKPPTPGNIKQAKMDLLSRTYPRAIAGTPLSFSFDPSSGAFNFSYVTDPRIDAPTEIFVPVARYTKGYVVKVSGPAVVTSAANAAVVTLRTTGRGTVTVTIARA
jgi:endoglycosylceramidase